MGRKAIYCRKYQRKIIGHGERRSYKKIDIFHKVRRRYFVKESNPFPLMLKGERNQANKINA